MTRSAVEWDGERGLRYRKEKTRVRPQSSGRRHPQVVVALDDPLRQELNPPDARIQIIRNGQKIHVNFLGFAGRTGLPIVYEQFGLPQPKPLCSQPPAQFSGGLAGGMDDGNIIHICIIFPELHVQGRLIGANGERDFCHFSLPHIPRRMACLVRFVPGFPH